MSASPRCCDSLPALPLPTMSTTTVAPHRELDLESDTDDERWHTADEASDTSDTESEQWAGDDDTTDEELRSESEDDDTDEWERMDNTGELLSNEFTKLGHL